ncbi:MAG TPA: enoyl-CoA hydratase [Paracoccus sp.]|nr:enoyl-CoA hydratase [Paracoccus sp. (in: a-proteobacteria)]
MLVELSPAVAGVATVTLNRPERLNALSMAVVEDFLAVLGRVAASDDIDVIVLTGAGRGFCAGGDVKEMETNRQKTLARRRHDLARMHELPRLLRTMPQVSVCAVNGPAYGAGFALALSCDLVVASDKARFGTAFLKQGLSSDFGLSYQLTRLCGPQKARQLIYEDAVLGADQALALGLAGAVVAADQLQDHAQQLARRVARHPRAARISLKRMLTLAETQTHATMLDEEAAEQIALLISPDHAESVNSFLTADKKTTP